MKLLVIEDDQTVAQHICKGLKEEGYVVDHCSDGKEGLLVASTEQFDLIVIDRMLPNVDGLTIVRTLRASGIDCPILMLTALVEVDQKVEGLRAGADDYLGKPFSFKELLARIQVLTRRQYSTQQDMSLLRAADIEFDVLKQKVTQQGVSLNLKPRERKLLEFLMRHKGQVLSRTMLLENVWEYHFDPQTNVIDVHISNLRQKIDGNRSTSLIRTVRGSGYVFDEN
jgi:two-component system OmpR family response regulator